MSGMDKVWPVSKGGGGAELAEAGAAPNEATWPSSPRRALTDCAERGNLAELTEAGADQVAFGAVGGG